MSNITLTESLKNAAREVDATKIENRQAQALIKEILECNGVFRVNKSHLNRAKEIINEVATDDFNAEKEAGKELEISPELDKMLDLKEALGHRYHNQKNRFFLLLNKLFKSVHHS